jgi:branched-chain amino acid transport system permease protein
MAIVVAFGLGIVQSLLQGALPTDSTAAADLIQSVPFIVTVLFLVYFAIRRDLAGDAGQVGGKLDRAIQTQGQPVAAAREVDAGRKGLNSPGRVQALGSPGPVIAFAAACLLPLLLHGFWIGLIGAGVAYAIIFLSYTLLIGEGGMIWLCQATFACIGGMTTAILATNHGWPVLGAAVLGGVVAVPFGVLVGLLTIRLGDLYVALVTLTFGLFMEDIVFSRGTFQNSGIGIAASTPSIISGSRVFAWFLLAIFAVLGLVIANLRRSTTGLALGAIRSSVAGTTTTLGISVLKMKLLVAGLASFVAGIGGAMVALSTGSSLAANYATLTGITWLAILVTLGIRSNVAALFAGITSTLIPGLVLVYLPKSWNNFLPIFFGIGAVLVAKFPDGTFAMQVRQARVIGRKFRALDGMRQVVLATITGALVVVVAILVALFPHEWWIWILGGYVSLHFVVGYIFFHREADPVAVNPLGGATAQV